MMYVKTLYLDESLDDESSFRWDLQMNVDTLFSIVSADWIGKINL